MEEILISIIVPAYNIEAYIGRCLDSIINQSHKKLEIIVVNDGSTDTTGDVINSYARKDPRIVPVHKTNGGVSSARLAGIRQAHGMYIGFIDGDDCIESTMYHSLLSNALAYDAQISHCGYKMIFPDGREDLYYGTGNKLKQNHLEALRALLAGERIEPSLCNKLYHRSVVEGFDQFELWDETIKINEDLIMNYLFFKKANQSVYEDKPFYHYIRRKGSSSTSNDKHYKLMDPLNVITRIKEDVKDHPELYQIVYKRYLRTLIGIAIQNNWKDDSKDARNTLRNAYRSSDFSLNCKSFKLRTMVFGIVYMQWLYRLIRKIYEKMTGINKKYAV